MCYSTFFFMFSNFYRLDLENKNLCHIISKSIMKHLQESDWKSDLHQFSCMIIESARVVGSVAGYIGPPNYVH